MRKTSRTIKNRIEKWKARDSRIMTSLGRANCSRLKGTGTGLIDFPLFEDMKDEKEAGYKETSSSSSDNIEGNE